MNKKIVYIIILIFSIITLKLCSQSNKNNIDSTEYKETDLQTKILKLAKKQLGVNYKYASCSPDEGFDCSGFVYYIFTKNGINVPRSSKYYTKDFAQNIELEDAESGDIMVFTGTDSSIRKPGHVGIVISNKKDSLKFIHASSSKKHGGIVITDYNLGYYKERFLYVKRVFN